MIGENFQIKQFKKIWNYGHTMLLMRFVMTNLKLAQYKKWDKKFYPEDISSAAWSYKKEIAETYLKWKVTDAVIMFLLILRFARQQTKDAGAASWSKCSKGN
jgi:molecular chaperone DnaK (HSP70)